MACRSDRPRLRQQDHLGLLVCVIIVSIVILVILVVPAWQEPGWAGAGVGLPAGTQEIGLSAGYVFSHELYRRKTTIQGIAFVPRWGLTLTGPIGQGWYRGQVTVAGELVVVDYGRPFPAFGVGVTPLLKYTFVGYPLDSSSP